MSAASTRNILVVGGGGYGATIARTLSAKIDPARYSLTLVSSHPFYIHRPATLRMIVTSQDTLEKSSLIPYDTLFVKGNGKFIQGTVVNILKNRGGKDGVVALTDGSTLPWDILVLTPGNIWEDGLDFPLTRPLAEEHVASWRKRFEQADKIVLVGGGAVGIELAGELRDVYKKKSITVVHGGERLLNDAYPPKYRKDLEKSLTSRGINVILSQHIDQAPGAGERLVTREGNEIAADLVVPTRGGKPNTAFIRSLGGSPLTPNGNIKIKPTLQLAGETNIFAAGDAIDFNEQKQVFKAPGHAAVVVGNLLAVLEGRPTEKHYKAPSEAILITNGRKQGKAYFDVLCGMRVGDWFVSAMKGKGLFVAQTRKALGLSA